MSSPDTLVMLLAGGRGERLYPLTRDRTKPAVPFGGIYRIVDFALSNCLNSGLRHIVVLTQYKSESLDRHLRVGWNVFNHEIGEYIDTVPPQQRFVDRWYEGTADAIYQNLHILNRERPSRVLILSGDHIYKMDYRALLAAHDEARAALTVATFETPIDEARQLGVLAMDDSGRIVDFEEKPADPRPAPGRSDVALSNMGVYVFDTEALAKSVSHDAKTDSAHDFGRNIIPDLVKRGARVAGYRFRSQAGRKQPYWRDVGTLDAYHEAHMDLLGDRPPITLRDPGWPLRTGQRQLPPAFLGGGTGDRPHSDVRDSLVAAGVEIRSARVSRSILSPGVTIEPGAVVEDSILLDSVHVGRGARVTRAVVDKQVRISEGYVLGGEEGRRGSLITESPAGLVTVQKGAVLD